MCKSRDGGTKSVTKAELLRRIAELEEKERHFVSLAESRLASEAHLFRSVHNLSFLSRTAMHFVRAAADENIWQFIADNIYSILCDGIILVTEFDPASASLIIRAVCADEPVSLKFQEELGGNPIGLAYTVPSDYMERVKGADFTLVTGGIHGLLSNLVPPDKARGIEDALGLGDIYIIPFSSEADIIGTVAIITSRDKPLGETNLIQAFVHQAAVALQRRWARDRHKIAEKEKSDLAKFPGENPNPVMRISPNNRITYANPASALIFDFWRTSEGDKLPDDFFAEVANCRTLGKSSDIEIRCGNVVYSLLIVPVPEGGYVNIYGKDITRRKQAESEKEMLAETLRRERDRFGVVKENTRALLAYLDRDFNFVDVNSTYVAASGHTIDEIIGQYHFKLYPDVENEAIFRRVRDTGRPVEFKAKPFEYPDQPERGITYWDWTLSPIKNESGEVDGLVLSLIEVTKHIKMEMALRDSEEKYRRLYDTIRAADAALRISEERYALAQRAANIGSWDWDIKTGDLKWSDQIEPMFGFGPKGFGATYEAFLQCVHPDDRDAVVRGVNDCLEKNNEYEIEHRIVWPDGTIHWVLEKGDVIQDEAGRPTRMLGLVQDITRRKHLEDALQGRTEALEAANKELEAFSYSVSHDLRAPLRVIDGFSLALYEDYADQLDEQAGDYIRRIRASARNMATLIDDILNLSRISRTEIHSAQINLSAVVKGIAKELRETEPERVVEFKIADKIMVDGDLQLLKILMQNLLNNAWKFTSKRTQGSIEFGKKIEGGRETYFVRDNGAGFDSKYIDKLFIPFQRLHSTSEYPGSGIGLAIVHRIVSRHGGRVWAESETDNGATFYFTLRTR
jgi:PAS domain S-box-containing protein